VHAPWLLSLATIMFESGAHAGTAAGVSVVYTTSAQLSGGRLLLLQTSLSPVGIGALLFQLAGDLIIDYSPAGSTREEIGVPPDGSGKNGTRHRQQQPRRANGDRDLKRKCLTHVRA
jgi:hypothetical protein